MIFAAGIVVLHITVGSLQTGTAHSVTLERVCNTTSVIRHPSCHMFQSEHSMWLKPLQIFRQVQPQNTCFNANSTDSFFDLYMSHCGYCGKVQYYFHTVHDRFNSGLVSLLRVFEPAFRVITLKRTLTQEDILKDIQMDLSKCMANKPLNKGYSYYKDDFRYLMKWTIVFLIVATVRFLKAHSELFQKSHLQHDCKMYVINVRVQ